MNTSPSLNSRTRRKGFTLIELLIVITIIAVLAGMAFPVTGAVLRSARKIQAKNDMANIINAVKAYQLEYHTYPSITGASSGDQVAASVTNNASLMSALMGTSGSNNPRGISFLEPKHTSSARGGLDSSTGAFYDPWGSVYYVQIDSDYDNTITDPSSGGGAINKGVIAYSSGSDATAGSTPNPSSPPQNGKNALYSWKN